MKERIAIVDGVRTPFCKSAGVFKSVAADDLGAYVVKELMARTNFPGDEVDEVIVGNAMQPAKAMNIARVIGVKAGLPLSVPAYTVHRNCASGMEAVTTAANKLLAGEADVIIAASAESMSAAPIMFPDKMGDFLMRMARAKTWQQKLKAIATFRLSLLTPVIALKLGLTDFVAGLGMGETAEVLARDFNIPREEQDAFALLSHQKAEAATQAGIMLEELMPLPVPPKYDIVQQEDDGIRNGQSMEALAKLRPAFDRVAGTVTPGNASQITDGAVALLVMRESTAKERGLTPLGYLKEYAYAGLEGRRMGLGPVFATSKLLNKTGQKMSDFELIELNEAFASQVIGCMRAASSEEFAREYLGRQEALGNIDPEILNVNGGAIALGHPVGATGGRLILTLLKELRRRNQQSGLATLCVGGGQGAALAMEVQ